MIVTVASGKGGTGKTLVATSLALALDNGAYVQFLDCDVEGPNAHLLLHPEITSSESVTIPVPTIDEERCTYCGLCAEICAYHAIAVTKGTIVTFPELCHGCGACSALCPEKAITEHGREVGIIEKGHIGSVQFTGGRLNVGEALSPPVVKAVKKHVNEEQAVIIDAPPGTSCPVVETIRGSDFCLLVTEPTPFGLNDLSLAVDVVEIMNIPCGVVINRDGAGSDEVEEFCRKKAIPVLLRIPLERRIAENYCRGATLTEGLPQWREPFQKLFQTIEQTVEAQG